MEKKHGGKRPGAGRPQGSSRYGEKTIPMRIPESRVQDIIEYLESAHYSLPLYSSQVAAGAPTMADEHVEQWIDLQQELVRHPTKSFLVRVYGDSMVNAAIYEGDMLVVDQSIEARHGHIVVAAVDGQITVKRLDKQFGIVRLMPENERYRPIEIQEDGSFVIWGVVTNVIHKV